MMVTKCFLLVSMIFTLNILALISMFYMFLISKHVLLFNKGVYFLIVFGVFFIAYFVIKKTYSRPYFLIIKKLSKQNTWSNFVAVFIFILIWFSSMFLFSGGLIFLRSVLY